MSLTFADADGFIAGFSEATRHARNDATPTKIYLIAMSGSMYGCGCGRSVRLQHKFMGNWETHFRRSQVMTSRQVSYVEIPKCRISLLQTSPFFESYVKTKGLNEFVLP